MNKEEIEKILNKCDKCTLNECIGCEITYTETNKIKKYIQQLETEVKELEAREQKVKKFLKSKISITYKKEDTELEKILLEEVVRQVKIYGNCILKLYKEGESNEGD